MPKTLHLNTEAIKADYTEAMQKALDEISYGYFNSVVSSMRTSSGSGDVTVESEDKGDRLIRQIIGGAFAVLDSWGSGSLMATDNPALQDYMNSDLWNPARPKTPGAPITGRPQGEYTDVFGESAYSSGAMEGLNLEQMPNSPIKPQAPSGAFQDTDKWFVADGTMVEVVREKTREFFNGVLRNSARYWRFG